MKPGDLEYQALVEKKRAEIRGNIESKIMSPEETAAEIAAVTDGAVSSFAGNEHMPMFIGKNQTPEPQGMPGSSLAQPPKKRGRPPGSRNKVRPTEQVK